MQPEDVEAKVRAGILSWHSNPTTLQVPMVCAPSGRSCATVRR